MADEAAELEQRLREAEAKIHQVEQATGEKRRLQELRFQVEAAERRAKDAPEIAKAEEEYGPIGRKIAVVETDLGAIVLKRPHHLVFRKFMNAQKTDADALWSFAKGSVVYPTVARVDEILEEYPAKLAEIANAVAELGGVKSKELAGK